MLFGRVRTLLLLVIFGLFALGACSPQLRQIEPPEEALHRAAQAPLNEGRKARRSFYENVQLVQPISFCYGSMLNDEEQLLTEAGDICKGGTLEVFSEEMHLRECPLFQPNRITYICTPGPIETDE